MLLYLHVDCSHPYVGDGFCDDWFNFEKCGYDGGDCCLSSMKNYFCAQCDCLQEDIPPYENCTFVNSIGDGICDDFANKRMCGYDHGLYSKKIL